MLVHESETLDQLPGNRLCLYLCEGLAEVALKVAVREKFHRNEDPVFVLEPASAANKAVVILRGVIITISQAED
jgi:hypothetical protein